MRPQSVRLALIVLVLLAAVGMSAAAGQQPTARDITATVTSPPLDTTPTPTPAVDRNTPVPQPPTLIEPGRIYEGNLSGNEATFLLNAELSQFFLLELETKDFDAVLEIYNEAGDQVARDDDGGSGNMPQLVFIAPATGQFKVVVRGYSEPVEGTYILRVNATIQTLEYGVPATVTHDGLKSSTFSFEAERGDVINLYADTNDTIDTTLKLLGPDGVQVAYIDDFSGIDPEFRRLPLTKTGRYFVIHAPYSESAVGEVPLTLEKTEVGTLSAEPVSITMTESTMKDVFNFDVVEDRLYVLTVTTRGMTYGTLEVTDIDGVSYATANYNSAEGGSIYYRASFTGTARLTVSVNDSSGSLPIGGIL